MLVQARRMAELQVTDADLPGAHPGGRRPALVRPLLAAVDASAGAPRRRRRGGPTAALASVTGVSSGAQPVPAPTVGPVTTHRTPIRRGSHDRPPQPTQRRQPTEPRQRSTIVTATAAADSPDLVDTVRSPARAAARGAARPARARADRGRRHRAGARPWSASASVSTSRLDEGLGTRVPGRFVVACSPSRSPSCGSGRWPPALVLQPLLLCGAAARWPGSAGRTAAAGAPRSTSATTLALSAPLLFAGHGSRWSSLSSASAAPRGSSLTNRPSGRRARRARGPRPGDDPARRAGAAPGRRRLRGHQQRRVPDGHPRRPLRARAGRGRPSRGTRGPAPAGRRARRRLLPARGGGNARA